MSYSIDFRRKALAIKKQENLTYQETATRFGVGIASLIRWNARLEPQLTRHKPASKIHQEALLEDVKTYPDAYQYERAERLGVSRSGIGDALKRLRISCKKKHSCTPKQILTHNERSKNALERIRGQEKPSFILMRVALRRICHAPMDMHRLESVVQTRVIGMRRDARMSSGR